MRKEISHAFTGPCDPSALLEFIKDNHPEYAHIIAYNIGRWELESLAKGISVHFDPIHKVLKIYDNR